MTITKRSRGTIGLAPGGTQAGQRSYTVVSTAWTGKAVRRAEASSRPAGPGRVGRIVTSIYSAPRASVVAVIGADPEADDTLTDGSLVLRIVSVEIRSAGQRIDMTVQGAA